MEETKEILEAEEQSVPAQEEVAAEQTQPVEQTEPVEQEPVAEAKKKQPKLNKKVLLIAAIAAVVVLAAIIAVSAFGGKSMDNYGLFFKEQEMFLVTDPEEELLEITSRFWDGDSDADKKNFEQIAAVISLYIQVRDNGTAIFYPDKLSDDSEGMTMYYRNLKKPEEDPVKIDVDITQIHVSDDGKKAVYIKGKEGNLYIHDLEDKTKIDAGVTSVRVNDDCSKIAYLTDENSYYLWEEGKDPVKLVSEITKAGIASDWTRVYYIKEGTLYWQEIGSDNREKISDDVNKVVKIYDSGEIYFIKENVVERKFADYVHDDSKEQDAKMTKPSYPNYPKAPVYPYSWNYTSDEAYEQAYAEYKEAYEEYEETSAALKEAYQQATAEYKNKQTRDELRKTLESASKEYKEYSLYYYNGTESVNLTDSMTGSSDIIYADDQAVVQYKVYSESNFAKAKLSEIQNAYEVQRKVEEAMYSSTENYVTVGGNAVKVEGTKPQGFAIAPDCASVYFMDDVSDNGDGDLYSMSISVKDGTVGAPELYEGDVSISYSLCFLEDSRIVYAKNVSQEKRAGDLYVAGERLDYDVALQNIRCFGDNMASFTDWNDTKDYGALQIKKIGSEEKHKIKDDVHSYMFLPNGDILYLYDYSAKHYAGDLFYYDAGKEESTRVSYDVMALIESFDPEQNHKLSGKFTAVTPSTAPVWSNYSLEEFIDYYLEQYGKYPENADIEKYYAYQYAEAPAASIG